MSIIKPLERGEDLRLYKKCINLQIIDILLSRLKVQFFQWLSLETLTWVLSTTKLVIIKG